MTYATKVLCVLATAAFAGGCSSNDGSPSAPTNVESLVNAGRDVIVTGVDGKPIAAAKVEAVALSMSTGPSTTDQQGMATVPINVQGAKWVRVSANGFETVQVDIPDTWPLRVTLPAAEK